MSGVYARNMAACKQGADDDRKAKAFLIFTLQLWAQQAFGTISLNIGRSG